jgi:hypothetical protein
VSWRPDDTQLVCTSLIALIRRLRDEEGLDIVRWVTLFNEPELNYAHDSQVWRDVARKEPSEAMASWDDYVRMHRRVNEVLQEFDPPPKLAVPDVVRGPAMRRERLELTVRDLGDLDLSYSFHNYNPEDPDFYVGIPYIWDYDGMAADCASLREIVGDDAELILWEFNNAGRGYHARFPGVTPAGEMVLESVANGAEISGKIFDALNAGTDGACLWCASDGIWHHEPDSHMMQFGLWRSAAAKWIPRPYYWYYAALCRSFRPGMRLLQTSGADKDANLLAARDDTQIIAAVINPAAKPRRVALSAPGRAPGELLRVHRGTLMTEDCMPVADRKAIHRSGNGFELELAAYELAVIQWSHP